MTAGHRCPFEHQIVILSRPHLHHLGHRFLTPLLGTRQEQRAARSPEGGSQAIETEEDQQPHLHQMEGKLMIHRQREGPRQAHPAVDLPGDPTEDSEP